MSLKKINTRTIVLVLMIVAVLPFRLLSYEYQGTLSNFTPIGAIALFGGAYFADKWKAYAVVLIALFLSDIPINYLYTSKLVLWNSSSIWVYLIFAAAVFAGSLLKKINMANVAVASLFPVVLHWLVTDLPWFYGPQYTHNLSGYGQSLLAALPFERNMLLADVFFCAVLFGGFELAKKKNPVLQSKKELAVS